MGENIIVLICFLPCPIIFTIIGIVAWRMKTPMHFWSGSKVLPEEVTDVKAYNHAYAKMWFVYTLPYWIATVLVFKSAFLAAILLGVCAIFGTIAMVAWYTMWIEKRYKWKYVSFHQSLKAEQEKKERIPRKKTKLEKNVDAVATVVFLGTIIWVAVMWRSFPDAIPRHYNAAGVVDAWSGKEMLIYDLAMEGGLYLLMVVTKRIPGTWNTPQKKTKEEQEKVYDYCGQMLSVVNLVIVIMFSYMTVCSALGRALGGKFLWLSLAGTFIPIVYYIFKMYQKN